MDERVILIEDEYTAQVAKFMAVSLAMIEELRALRRMEAEEPPPHPLGGPWDDLISLHHSGVQHAGKWLIEHTDAEAGRAANDSQPGSLH